MEPEEEIIAGNLEDKYQTRNPISRSLVSGFLEKLEELFSATSGVGSVLEVGAGSGDLTEMSLMKSFPEVEITAIDVVPAMVDEMTSKFAENENIRIAQENLEDLSFGDDSFDFIVACEVLEHVTEPVKSLKEMYRVAKKYVLISTPNEPLWSLLNVGRGKYWSRLGNTPGHINKWSKSGLRNLVEEVDFCVVEERNPVPWTMLLLEK